MRRQCRKRAMQYHNLALEESKPELRAGKKHYALFRVMGAVTVVLLTILAAVAACSHFFPELNMSAIGRIVAGLIIVVAAVALFALGTFRHTYRSWLDAVGTGVAVQWKMMRHTDSRTTMNIYGDVVMDEMTTAGIKVAQLAFQSNGAQTERRAS